MLPSILAGRPILPSEATFRAVPFNTLPSEEQDDLIERMVPDSGRAFRAMTFGAPSTRVRRGAVSCPVLCVSGTADRNVSNATSRRIARRYGAEHKAYPGKPHWIVAESLVEKIAPPVLDLVQETIAPARVGDSRVEDAVPNSQVVLGPRAGARPPTACRGSA